MKGVSKENIYLGLTGNLNITRPRYDLSTTSWFLEAAGVPLRRCGHEKAIKATVISVSSAYNLHFTEIINHKHLYSLLFCVQKYYVHFSSTDVSSAETATECNDCFQSEMV